MKNAIGTIDLFNAITILKFRGSIKPFSTIVAKNFLSEVTGDFDFGYCPVFSEEIIAYTQTRWAVIANIKTGRVETPVLTKSLDNIIGGIASLDTARNLFVVDLRTPAGDAGFHKILHVMKHENKKFVSLGSIPAGIDGGYSQPWIVHDRKIITYDSSANRLLCHGADLKPVTHPFVEILNRNNEKFRKLKEMIIHPTLPFGLVVEIGKDTDWSKYRKMEITPELEKIEDSLYELEFIHVLYLLRWDTSDTNKQYIPLHTDTLSLLPPLAVEQYSRFTFSPDGKWLVFGHEDMSQDKWGNLFGGRQRPFFVALPVDEKKPFFFGEPVFMGRTSMKDNYLTTTAWATNPTAFVAADGLLLYKWDLDNLHEARVLNTPDTIFPLK